MVFYFTGTGNSLYAAKTLDKDIKSILHEISDGKKVYSYDKIGIVCPIYGHEMPKMVKKFIATNEFDTDYLYIVLTYRNRKADAAGADLFELTPVIPYTSDDLDWNDSNSRVSKEHENESLQNDVELVSTTVDNRESYDTVFIGYPILWRYAAWPVNQFMTKNDFTGKTVIPFCTSMSSGLGNSAEKLRKMTKGGDWKEGMKFSSSPDMSEVESWAKSVVN